MQFPSPVEPVETNASAGASAAGRRPASTRPLSAPPGERPLLVRPLLLRSDVLVVGVSALVATLLARGVAPALPGSSAGIGPLIVGVEQLASFSTQFMAVLGVSTCVRLLLSTLECRSPGFRLVAIVSSAAGLPVVISASSRQLSTSWLIALAGLSATLGLAAARPALKAEHSRAAGLMLLVVTLGSLVSAFGRVLALYASQELNTDLFGVARGIATGAVVVDALSIGLAGVWLARRWRFGTALLISLAGLGALLAWMGVEGADLASASRWEAFLSRAFAALTAHPDPFIQAGFRYFVEICAILLAAVMLWFRRPGGVGEVFCFALLARVSGDVPSCALMLMLAALCAVRASLESIPPRSAALEPAGRRASLEVVPVTR